MRRAFWWACAGAAAAGVLSALGGYAAFAWGRMRADVLADFEELG